jgi:prepilin signal peptidase PulO-like enzyme (type II secretory pathway)
MEQETLTQATQNTADGSANGLYSIPISYRKMENLHIVFWLLKDISWCLIWRPLGIIMIFPTLIISIIIAWRTRQFMSELCHNLAITVWITANSYWMISEFLHFESVIVTGSITYKHLAVIPFVMGVLILAYYYLYYKPNHKDAMETM